MSGSQCGFEGTVDLDSALRDSCLNQLQDVEISLEAELVDSEAEIKIGYIYWVFSMLYHYLYYYVYIPSFWVFLIGIIWYTVARYCTRLFSRQSSFPSGFYGESIIFGWLERTNQRSVVWASRCLKTKLKYNSQVLDIGFGAGLSFDTMIRLLGESFESHCHENKGVEKAEYKVYGIENSEQMIRYCTEKYASEIENKVLVLEKGDALSMSYPNESFDVITVSNFIHLVKDKNAALKEWVWIILPKPFSLHKKN
uniref:Methyltransferase type 11 domain-containing protein n=1 Tax=Aplanochytrium stocchinoi TaxID=215587 RepID=A0A6S8CH79_9STRA|mmetsp:Transcript_22099/g.26972  ORF Transcript_22099/g.26972 Transcript_22099/m.26972 type:complete len:254 (+) Transcript_22099:140-901(+)